MPVGTATVVIPSVKGTKASTKAGAAASDSASSPAESEEADAPVAEKAGASK